MNSDERKVEERLLKLNRFFNNKTFYNFFMNSLIICSLYNGILYYISHKLLLANYLIGVVQAITLLIALDILRVLKPHNNVTIFKELLMILIIVFGGFFFSIFWIIVLYKKIKK